MQAFAKFVAVSSALVLFAFGGAFQGDGKTLIPPFVALGSDGRTYDNQKLLAPTPILLVYFTSSIGPETEKGIADMIRLSKELKPKVRVVGIMGGIYAGVPAFVKKRHIPFLVVCDSTMTTKFPLFKTVLSKDWDATEFTSALIVSPGKVLQVWKGYSRHTVNEMVRILRKSAGMHLKIRTSWLPAKLTVGGTDMYGGHPH